MAAKACCHPLLPFHFLKTAQFGWSGLFKREAQWHHLLPKSVQWPLASVKAKDKFLAVAPQALIDLAPLLSLSLNHHLPSFSCFHPCSLPGHLVDLEIETPCFSSRSTPVSKIQIVHCSLPPTLCQILCVRMLSSDYLL